MGLHHFYDLISIWCHYLNPRLVKLLRIGVFKDCFIFVVEQLK